MTEYFYLKIVLTLTVGFGLAALLGYFTHRLKLSPICGYLIAGYLIGPFSPGIVGDLQVSEQLAEIGVILMLFGVGLHFSLEDLLKYKDLALPGAIVQTLATTVIGGMLIYFSGWPIEYAIIFGLAIAVASTVVLVRVLSDNHMLNSPEGHVAVGWLIVEDIITVIALLLVPTLAAKAGGEHVSTSSILMNMGLAIAKFIAFVAIMFTIGRRVVKFIFHKVIDTHSHELFTLTILAVTFVIAVGSSLLFGTSIALGAFIAGMVIGKTDIRHKVSSNTTPLSDTFVVIFFLSIGMLFNPMAIVEHYPLFFAVLAIILVIKPLAAFLITVVLKYPYKMAIVLAVALAQIGEFSFILAEEANRLKIFPDEGFDIVVACALVSISLNPLLFKLIVRPEPVTPPQVNG